jgi:hypothetical protein
MLIATLKFNNILNQITKLVEEDCIIAKWAQEDVDTLYNLPNIIKKTKPAECNTDIKTII